MRRKMNKSEIWNVWKMESGMGREHHVWKKVVGYFKRFDMIFISCESLKFHIRDVGIGFLMKFTFSCIVMICGLILLSFYSAPRCSVLLGCQSSLLSEMNLWFEFWDDSSIYLGNKPFYSCVLSCLAFEWKWGWFWPCFCRNLTTFLILMMLFSC